MKLFENMRIELAQMVTQMSGTQQLFDKLMNRVNTADRNETNLLERITKLIHEKEDLKVSKPTLQ